MSNNRDTQFAGFAHALAEEILLEMEYSVGRASQDVSDNLEKLLARRAYDLAVHVADHARGAISRDPELVLKNVPGMPELPKEQE